MPRSSLGSFWSTTGRLAREQTCALCGRVIERGYVRESQSVCSTAIRSASWGTRRWRSLPSETIRGKCHEMLTPRLHSWPWPRLLPARLVRQGPLLFTAMLRCLRDRATEAVATRTARNDLSTAEIDASCRPRESKVASNSGRLTPLARLFHARTRQS